MPVFKCSNGKYRIGNSDCIYDTKEKAEEVWKALLSKGIYVEQTYDDYPKSASDNAERAIKWAEENGWGSCGTQVGKIRASQLANREPISRDTIARMSAFRRHQQSSNKELGDGCLTSSEFLCDGYVTGGTNNQFKSLIINAFLCDGYVIGSPILFDGHLIKD